MAMLLTGLFLGVLQLGVALYVRNTLIWCASEGARVAARAAASDQDGQQRTRELITAALSASYAKDIRVSRTQLDGMTTVVVVVAAPAPVLGLIGPDQRLLATGRALQEPP